METPQYIGEIRLWAGPVRVPVGWTVCDGKSLPISEYRDLYDLIGKTYGGDAATFAVPDLRGRMVIGHGKGGGVLSPRALGERGGEEEVTLTVAQLPRHTHHPRAADSVGTSSTPANNSWATSSSAALYDNKDLTARVAMNPDAVLSAGDGQAHENMLPFTAINYIIALIGELPS